MIAEVLPKILAEAAVLVTALVAFIVMMRKQDKRLHASERRIATNVQSATATINGFFDVMLDAMPYPAWVKIVKEEDGSTAFRMLHINRAYEDWYGVERSEYKGRTDFEIWPRPTAEDYYSADSVTLRDKRGTRFVEPISTPLRGNAVKFEGRKMEFEKLYVEHKGERFIMGMLRPTLEVLEELERA